VKRRTIAETGLKLRGVENPMSVVRPFEMKTVSLMRYSFAGRSLPLGIA
jgi:hypothetical protein